MTKKNQQSLGLDGEKKSGPLDCLGQTFPSDEKRREHYLKLLGEKLKDPEFRKTPGFPKGSDDNILRLSDPPYYTACPNPFLAQFSSGTNRATEDAFGAPATTEPFAFDVSEGKQDPVCMAHTYHTKVPYRAIVRYILHYTNPGDLVLDSFWVFGKSCGWNQARGQEVQPASP